MLVTQWASAPYPLQKTWVTSLAALGYLALNIEPHDVPADMPQAFYDALPGHHQAVQHDRNAEPRRELLPPHVPRRLSRRRVPREPARLGWQDDRRHGHEHGRPAELRRRRPQPARDRSDRERSRRRRRHGGAAQAVGELPELERVRPARARDRPLLRHGQLRVAHHRALARRHGLHRRRLRAGGDLGGVQSDHRPQGSRADARLAAQPSRHGRAAAPDREAHGRMARCDRQGSDPLAPAPAKP